MSALDHQPVIIGGGARRADGGARRRPRPVRLLCAGGLGGGAASAWAQGGLAAAIGAEDSPALHIADTLAAGAGLCDGAAVRRIVDGRPGLDRVSARAAARGSTAMPRRQLALGLEAAHQRRAHPARQGDQTGAEIMRALIAAARATAIDRF